MENVVHLDSSVLAEEEEEECEAFEDEISNRDSFIENVISRTDDVQAAVSKDREVLILSDGEGAGPSAVHSKKKRRKNAPMPPPDALSLGFDRDTSPSFDLSGGVEGEQEDEIKGVVTSYVGGAKVIVKEIDKPSNACCWRYPASHSENLHQDVCVGAGNQIYTFEYVVNTSCGEYLRPRLCKSKVSDNSNPMELFAAEYYVTRLIESPDGESIAAKGRGDNILLANLERGTKHFLMSPRARNGALGHDYVLNWSKGGKRIYWGSYSGTPYFYKIEEQVYGDDYQGESHGSCVHDIAPDREKDEVFYSVGDDNRVIKWDLRTQKRFVMSAELPDEKKWGCAQVLSLHGDNDQIAIGTAHGGVFHLSARNMRKEDPAIQSYRAHQDEITRIEWCPWKEKSHRLVTSSVDSTLKIWSLKKSTAYRTPVFTYGGHNSQVMDFSCNKDVDGCIASVSCDYTEEEKEAFASSLHIISLDNNLRKEGMF